MRYWPRYGAQQIVCPLDAQILNIADESRAGRHLNAPLQATFRNAVCRHDAGDRVRIAVVLRESVLAQPDDRVGVGWQRTKLA